MSPPRRIHISPSQLAAREGNSLALSPEQARYLVSVLRLESGERIELFDGVGHRFSARLQLESEGKARLENVEPLEKHSRANQLDVVLAQALAKSDKLELVIQKATELGCARIIPLAAGRSVVKLDEDRGKAKLVRWRKIAEEAARQCGRDDVPAIDEPSRWEDLFAILESDRERLGIALDPTASVRLAAAALGRSKLLLAIGPEGGFSSEELERAQASNLVRASLGPLILRTETAGLAALSIVQHLAGALG